ncbi:MurR/RpiR family transcriptional regulator [Carnobacterium mobile]|uniref:MurR/RpiR family transcriptional regulator n=1 Tax=Carnobacterium mobile TaxID=2750 RepID=UPI00186689D8|nr:MurR/RpiR family transcriptional regulator [Carnobacterium mobile]
MSLQKQISLHADSLTDMEKNLLHNIIENKGKFEYETFTIALISNTFNVSKTSVHRLTKKLEYSSFLHFKDEFFLRFRINEDMVIEKNSEVDLLLDTFHAVQESITPKMIHELIEAKRITIYGMGMNSFIGKMFQIKLQLLGKHVEQYDDSRYMRVSARNLKENEDIVIVLSRSGRPPELLEAVVKISLKKIYILLITEQHGSPLESLATEVLYTSHSPDSDSDIDTRLNSHIAMNVIMKKFIEENKKGQGYYVE